MSGFSFASTDHLARKLGVTFAEAARIRGRAGGRKAARRRQQRQCACLEQKRVEAVRWDLKD